MEERVKTIHERSSTRPALVKTTLDICTVHCCMIHLEALEGYTSQGLSICWRSCLRNSVTISEWLWSHMVQTSTLSSASTATLTGAEYLRQLHVSGAEGDWLTPLTPPSAPVRHCSLKSVDFHVHGSLTLSIDVPHVVYLNDGKHNGPCSSNLMIKVRCFHSRPNINTYCDWESSPWKCSGLGKTQNTNYAHLYTIDAHLFNMSSWLWWASGSVWCNIGATGSRGLRWWPLVWLLLT